MFVLVTGAPGSGKTSHVLDHFHKETRPIFYRGIRDLKLPWTELTDEQTLAWPEHVPEGAILIVDEAQQLWPVRPSSKPVPAGLTALETHRHHGWDVWFITQEPTLLDSHARKIANEHYHYVRTFGMRFTTEYHSGGGAVSVSNKSALASCNKRQKPLPKHVWGMYHSAEVHTHKARPPWVIYLVAVAALVAVTCFWLFFKSFAAKGADDATTVSTVATGSGSPGGHGQLGLAPPGSGRPEDWGRLFKPDVPGLPYTAPLYRGHAEQVKAVPVVHGCMSMQQDFSDCSCWTQQGTRIADMPQQMCAAVLRDGLFNHLQADDKGDARRRDGDAEGRGAPHGAAQTSL